VQRHPARRPLTVAGFDLDGNSYWEWKIVKHAARTRRIVEYPGGVHHSDVDVPRMSPPGPGAAANTRPLTPCSAVGTMAPPDARRSADHG
jgi:NADH dehydrogenase [ubiquinone] 1 alpha subcomplex assembly factor 2